MPNNIITDGIKYRNYQKGDARQLAYLFNIAFQQNGANFLRTTRTWKWRYLESPEFKPEMCHLAVDTENEKIVGAIYANMIERILIDGKKYKIGHINDVSCHPAYTRRGIAQYLMEKAIDYMKSEGCEFSLLTADYSGVARKKIYLKFGYKDIDRMRVFINFPHPEGALEGFPVLFPFIPFLWASTNIPAFINKLRLRWSHFLAENNLRIELHHNSHHEKYYNAFHEIIPNLYTAAPLYDAQILQWQRETVPLDRFESTYVLIKQNSYTIGAGVLSAQIMQSWKYHFSIRIGSIHDLFLDRSHFTNRRTLYFA
ncbi:MAG: GNAT family N-acetyltransferase, partial [Promethearchaeia archaeon]